MIRTNDYWIATLALAIAAATCPVAHAATKFDERGKVLDSNAETAKVDTARDNIRDQVKDLPATALQAIKEALSARRADSDYDVQDARALSTVLRMFDESDVPTQTTNTEATFTNLPRSSWWCMFVDVGKWDAGPLAFDVDESPGFYAAMMGAFEKVLVEESQPLDVGSYVAMHGLVTRGTFHKVETVFEPIRSRLNEHNKVTFGIAEVGVDAIDDTAFGELNEAKLAYLTGDLPSTLDSKVSKALARGLPKGLTTGPVTYEYSISSKKVLATSQYKEGEASGRVSDLIYAYKKRLQQIEQDGEMEQDKKRVERIKAICKLVRGLHVSHVFPDANGRLNTMLLLNKLLIDQGLLPSIVENTSIFGGRATVSTLMAAVDAGQKRFASVVTAARGGSKTCR